MTGPTQDHSPGMLPAHQPETLTRPPYVFPAAPRVVYRTAREDLSHEGRIKRIDQSATLAAFRAFSDTFHARDTLRDPALRACLHNHGFLPDKGALYGLPNDALEDYLSDFLALLLPMANGHCAIALRDRRLFWQLYRGLLPLAPMAGMVLGGKLLPGGTHDGPVLARALMSDAPAPSPAFYPTLDAVPRDQGDLVLLGWPQTGDAPRGVLRLALIHDHQADHPTLLGAVFLHGAPDSMDHPEAQVLSAPVALTSGVAGPARGFCRKTGQRGDADRHPAFVLGPWARLMSDLTEGLLRLPIGVVIQLDLVLTPEGAIVVDATDRLDASAYQIHAPLMASPVAKAFLREFGL